MKSRNSKFFVIAAVLAIAAVLWQTPWNSSNHDHQDEDDHDHEHHDHHVALTDKQIADNGIKTQSAEGGELKITLSTRGKIILHPDCVVHVLPKFSAVAYEARKNIGDTVHRGEIIAVLESREMAEIKADYLAALEKLKLASSSFDREQRLFDKKISSEQEYLNSKSANEEANINLQLAKQKLYAYGMNEKEISGLSEQNGPELRLYEIRSPIDGVVIDRHFTRGEYIDSNTLIYEIADLSRLWVEIGTYPKDLSRVKTGQVVEISLPSDNVKAEAKIIYLSPIIQEETITAKAIAELANHDRLWRPGTYVNVAVTTSKVPAKILIPKEAVQTIDGEDVVFVQTAEGFEKRSIQKGRCDQERVEIVSGLNPAEKYACENTFLLKADLGKEDAEHEH